MIGADRVMKLIKSKKLIEGLDPDNMNFEGCGVDLRLGEIYEMAKGEGKILIETRDSPKFRLVAKYKKGVSKIVSLKPGIIYLGKTIEKINTPSNLFGWFIPRATLYRCGVIIEGIRTDPSYRGEFTFMICNIGKARFRVELGARIANMVFHEVRGRHKPYIGQWQGGRVFIEKEERQTKQA